MARILAVDDEPDLLETVRRILVRAGHTVVDAPSGHAAREVLAKGRVDLVVTDLMMPGLDGMAVLAAAREVDASIPVVVMTAYATVETAVAAMRAGAWDYVPKPFSADQLRLAVDRALQHRSLADENRRLRRALAGPSLVGESVAMKTVAEMVQKVGPTDLTVLVTGELGTGKEVVARGIHAASGRAGAPFVAVDCGAIPASLVESELFGHEKGAFTGADAERRGLVEEAEGGTFFLDEIGDLDATAQTRLLRLLQEGEFRRVGDNRMRRANLRVLAATNRDLDEAVAAGKFRADLFHRLNVVRVHLPPLRERRDDVPALFAYFVARFRAESGRASLPLSPALSRRLLDHEWPGNVRELVNVARFVAGLAPGPEAQLGDLPPGFGQAPRAPVAEPGVRVDLAYADAKRAWTERFDEVYFTRLLDAHEGNISAAARAADIDRKTIQRWVKRSGDD